MTALSILTRTAAPLACAIAALASALVREPPRADERTPNLAVLRVTAVVTDTSVAGLVVEATAPDMRAPLRFTIAVESNFAGATIRIPAGRARTIAVRGRPLRGRERRGSHHARPGDGRQLVRLGPPRAEQAWCTNHRPEALPRGVVVRPAGAVSGESAFDRFMTPT